jgi:hypothetical protein
MKYNHNTDVYVLFYNDRILEAIPASEIAEPFTYVPIRSKHLEVVGGNVVVFGNLTEGYPSQPVDVTIELNSESLAGKYSEVKFPLYGVRRDWSSESNGRYWYDWVLVASIPDVIYTTVGSTYFISVKDPSWASAKQAVYTVLPGDTVADVIAGLSSALTIAGVSVVTNITGLVNVICMETRMQYFDLNFENFFWDSPPYRTWTLLGKITSDTFVVKNPQLKRGSKHGFGIVYKDDCARQNSVAKTDELMVNIPFYDEVIYYGQAIGGEWMDSGVNTIINPTFLINSKPPSWAETYEIVYCGNLSMDSWLQLRAKSITDLTNHRYSLSIQETIDEIRAMNARWKVPDWEWTDGDRLRFIGTINNTDGSVLEFPDSYDYEIEAIYGGVVGGDFIFQAVNTPPFFGSFQILVEVYRPKKGMGASVFYGTGMVFEVGTDAYGNKYHKGDVDQELDSGGNVIVPAEIINTAFDSWKFMRLNYKEGDTATKLPFWCESNMVSDWWEGLIIANKIASSGFPFLYDISQKQNILTKRFRHGGELKPGTQINDIAHFTYLDFTDLAEKDGDITGLREIGYTLKVLQLHKETSVYINRIQTFNPDGTEQFTLIDRLIGTINPSETIFGCQHPDSVLVEGRNLYYWDNIQGEIIRSAPNGQIAISGPEYKMSRWFKDLTKWIRSTGGAEKLNVRFGYNVEHDELWCSFVIDSTVYGAIFSETFKRWITRIDQITDAYVHAGEFFAHLYKQKLWVMNIDEGQDYLSWSGVETTAELEFVSNIDPKKNKVFNAIALYSDHLMTVPAGYIRIPREASVALMETSVAIWEMREGIYYGTIQKDQNSPGVWASANAAAMNGRAMRGRYCYVKLKTDEHGEKVRLDSVIVFSTPSERNI